jgi:hypothetical protein
MVNYTQDELIRILESAVVPHENWCDRNTSAAQRQTDEALSLLKAGCPFRLDPNKDMQSNDRTTWIEIQFREFSAFDCGGADDTETYYIPTWERLKSCEGRDWC